MSDAEARARRIVTNAPTDLIVDRLAAELLRTYGITRTELFQVDYRLAELLPLGGGESVTGPGHPAWYAFDHQEPIIADGTGWFPVGMRGERRGVLRVSPAPADPAARAELATIAAVLGHELAAVTSTTDVYLAARRSRRLTLAAEMQWELLPGRSRIRPSFALAGQLEPAYAVRGGSFDWSDDGHRLWLAVLNGFGEGVAAALLTSLATFALRNARRAGLSLADQAALADQAIYAQHRGRQHLAVLLMEVDLATGTLTAVDAGSPHLIRLRAGAVTPQVLDKQFPLGMFEGTDYREQRFPLARGDRLFVVSDGVVDAAAGQIRYGESALDRFLRHTGPLEPLDAVRSLIGDLRAFVAGDLVDDAVVVCLDWLGPQPENGPAQ
ncbi:PP2C family protein-serine/threonine phosphatase [Micromonospora sp. WMMD998]|uniref:PP2C family protein-serine/threonine phosphatase n=1 Tax=Micromonospora sp. WMMD998 TaxID=3016092 RepID=UPI00249AE854|nr:PP2C family protein-serine/threonine phosphatase [Micromonospora sp. WMMD998]WFE42029.1 PP2C family protein-serine/threonine phosphatase [Micromonospora sp. WMMD998]